MSGRPFVILALATAKLGAAVFSGTTIALQGYGSADCTGAAKMFNQKDAFQWDSYDFDPGADLSTGTCFTSALFSNLQHSVLVQCTGGVLKMDFGQDACTGTSAISYTVLLTDGTALFQGGCAPIATTVTGQGADYEINSFQFIQNVGDFSAIPPCVTTTTTTMTSTTSATTTTTVTLTTTTTPTSTTTLSTVTRTSTTTVTTITETSTTTNTSTTTLTTTTGTSTTSATSTTTVTRTSTTTLTTTTETSTTSTTHTTTTMTTDTRTTFTITYTPSTVGNDPITIFGKVRKEFWLPVGVLMPLIETPDVAVLAATFAGNPYEQWFDRFVVTSAHGDPLVRVAIKKGIASFNRSSSLVAEFETLDVRLGRAAAPLVAMPAPSDVIQQGGIMLTFGRMSRLSRVRNLKIGRAHRECVEVGSFSLHFVICSSAANEYYGHHAYLAVEYAHLDMTVYQVHNPSSFTGILPELWGLKPLSALGTAVLAPPPAEVPTTTTMDTQAPVADMCDSMTVSVGASGRCRA